MVRIDFFVFGGPIKRPNQPREAFVGGDVRAAGLSDRSAIGYHRLGRGHLKVVWARLFGQCEY
jgi:hypothetical protein